MKTRVIAPYIVAVIVTAFLVFLAYVMFFVPQFNEAAKLRDQTASAHSTNQTLTRKVNLIQDKAKNLDELKSRVAAFNQAFPVGAAEQELMDSIVSAAGQSGITITGVTPNAPAAPDASKNAAAPAPAPAVASAAGTATAATPAAAPAPAPGSAAAQQKNTVGTLHLTINARGPMDGLSAFVNKVEALKRPLMITTLDLHQSGADATLTIGGDTFVTAPLAVPAQGQ